MIKEKEFYLFEHIRLYRKIFFIFMVVITFLIAVLNELWLIELIFYTLSGVLFHAFYNIFAIWSLVKHSERKDKSINLKKAKKFLIYTYFFDIIFMWTYFYIII